MSSSVPYTKLSPGKKGWCTCRKILLSVLAVFVAITAGVFLFVGIGSACCFPMHASCSVDWTFEASCVDVENSLVKQITQWESAQNCEQGGEKCLYEVVSRTHNRLMATHETPTKHYIDDMTFEFTQNNKNCSMKALSSSRTWYAVLDHGTNYCNMFNLIDGAGLNQLPGYSEATCDRKCTQYSSANCEVY